LKDIPEVITSIEELFGTLSCELDLETVKLMRILNKAEMSRLSNEPSYSLEQSKALLDNIYQKEVIKEQQ